MHNYNMQKGHPCQDKSQNVLYFLKIYSPTVTGGGGGGKEEKENYFLYSCNTPVKWQCQAGS